MAITKNLELVRGSNGGGVGLKATITAPRTTGSTTFTVDSVGNINSSFIATSGTPDPDRGIITSNKLVWEGHVSGSNLVLDTVAPGYTDAGNSANDIVVIKPTSHWADVLVETLEVSHNTDGTLKDDAVTTAAIADGAVTPAKLSSDNYQYVTWTPTANSNNASATWTNISGSASLTVPSWATKAIVLASLPAILAVTADVTVLLRSMINTDTGTGTGTYLKQASSVYRDISWTDEITLSATGSQTLYLQSSVTSGSGAFRTYVGFPITVTVFYR